MRVTNLCVFVVAASTMFAFACGTDSTSDDTTDATAADGRVTDTGGTADTAPGTDAGSTADGTMTDGAPGDVATVGEFELSGNIFWNRPDVPDGSLLIALSTTSPASAPFAAEQTFDPATLPTAYEFTELPAGTYYLVAFLDVGRDSAWDAPSREDFFAISEGAAGLSDDHPQESGINVELR